jgi:hypothetical protein
MADLNTVRNAVNTNLAQSGANSDITSLSGLTTPLSVAQGGTGSTTATGSLTALGAVAKAGDTMTGALTINAGLTVNGALTAGAGGTLTSMAINSATLTSATINSSNINASGLTSCTSVSSAFNTGSLASCTINSSTLNSCGINNGDVNSAGIHGCNIDTSILTSCDLRGSAMSGSWGGNPTFTGNPSFTGSPTFTGPSILITRLFCGAPTSSTGPSPLGVDFAGTTADGIILNDNSFSGGGAYAVFAVGASIIGSINNAGNAGVTYNTTSDIRLKTDVTPITDETPLGNVGALIDSLAPVSWTWVSNGQRDNGFVAQELVKVVPGAVAVGSGPETNPGDPGFKPWGVDASRLVVFLVAEIQSLRKRVAVLEGH